MHDNHGKPDDDDLMHRLQRAVAKALKDEGIDADLISGGTISADGEIVSIPLDDDTDSEDTRVELRELAKENGKVAEFEAMEGLFTAVEASHAEMTNGQSTLAAIDKLGDGKPLRAFFAGAKDKRSATKAVNELIETGDLPLLLEFMYELGKACDTLPKLQALLGRKLAIRLTSAVTGTKVTEAMIERAARKVGSTRELEAVRAAQKGKDKPDCTCPVCTARRERERSMLH